MPRSPVAYLLFGGDSTIDGGKGADSFMGSFLTVNAAKAWFDSLPNRDPETGVDWGQVVAWDGGTLTVIQEARRCVRGVDGYLRYYIWHDVEQ